MEPKTVFPSASFLFFLLFRQTLAVGTRPRTPTATLATTEGSRPSSTTGATLAGAGEGTPTFFCQSRVTAPRHTSPLIPPLSPRLSGLTTAASAGAEAVGETPAGWRRPETTATGPSRRPATSGSNSETFSKSTFAHFVLLTSGFAHFIPPNMLLLYSFIRYTFGKTNLNNCDLAGEKNTN